LIVDELTDDVAVEQASDDTIVVTATFAWRPRTSGIDRSLRFAAG
jgi:hypothetical protein